MKLGQAKCHYSLAILASTFLTKAAFFFIKERKYIKLSERGKKFERFSIPNQYFKCNFMSAWVTFLSRGHPQPLIKQLL